MKNKSILITGATGFVGASLVRYFADGGWQVTASGRDKPPAALLAHALYLQADICRPMPAQTADVVVHAAALASDTASRTDLEQTNIEGTRRVFAATQACQTFVFISSSSVYDFSNDLHTEDEPVDWSALSLYGRSKRLAENWLLEQDWRGRTLIILRPRAVYGCGDRVLLPRLLRLVRRGRIVMPGDMRVQSSLTHVHNLCLATAQCITHAAERPGGVHIFNVADAESYEMRQVVQRLLSQVVGRELTVRSLPLAPLKWVANVAAQLRIPASFTPLALTAVSRNTVLDLTAIMETVGCRPTVHLWSALPEIAAWANRVGMENVRLANKNLPWL